MPANPLTLIIFGASGDLTSRKLIPSLYNLDRKKRLPAELKIVGVSRRPFSDDAFRDGNDRTPQSLTGRIGGAGALREPLPKIKLLVTSHVPAPSL